MFFIMHSITPAQQYLTRAGFTAIVYTTNGGGPKPVHGAIYDSRQGLWHMRSWTKNGLFKEDGSPHSTDLIKIKPKAPIFKEGQIPSWARFVAKNKDNTVVFFERKPVRKYIRWDGEGCGWGMLPATETPFLYETPWKDSLFSVHELSIQNK